MSGNNMGRQRRRQEARASKADIVKTLEDLRWKRPPREEWDNLEPSTEHMGRNSRIITAISYVEWKVVHYSIKHEVRRTEHWFEVYRSDSSHDEVHRHEKLPTSNDYVVLREFTCLEDVDEAYVEEHNHVRDTCGDREQSWSITS